MYLCRSCKGPSSHSSPKSFSQLSSRNVVLPKGNVLYSLCIIKPSNRHFRYVEQLEDRLEKLEGLLNKVHFILVLVLPLLIRPQFDPDQRALEDPAALELDIESTDRPSTSSLQFLSPANNVATSIIPNNPRFASLDLNANDHTATPDGVDEITQCVSMMGVDAHFAGKTSSASLAILAKQVKSAYTGIPSAAVNLKREELWTVPSVSHISPFLLDFHSTTLLNSGKLLPGNRERHPTPFPLWIYLTLSSATTLLVSTFPSHSSTVRPLRGR